MFKQLLKTQFLIKPRQYIIPHRYYTLQNIVFPKDSHHPVYDKLRDVSSTYSKLFNDEFIDKLHNIQYYDNGCIQTNLATANNNYNKINEYNNLWKKLPPQFIMYYKDTEKLLHDKFNYCSNIKLTITGDYNKNIIKKEVQKDLNDLINKQTQIFVDNEIIG